MHACACICHVNNVADVSCRNCHSRDAVKDAVLFLVVLAVQTSKMVRFAIISPVSFSDTGNIYLQDLSPFASDKFSAKEWVNSVFRQDEAQGNPEVIIN